MKFTELTNIFFGREKIEVNFFGELTLYKTEPRHWRGNVNFAPTEEKVFIYIFDEGNGIKEIYKKFYIDLENKYCEFADEIAVLLQKTLKETGRGTLSHESVWKQFKLAGISFPLLKELESPIFEWDLDYSFNSEHPKFLVEMRNWKPENCYFSE
jgi:hypothetical protein